MTIKQTIMAAVFASLCSSALLSPTAVAHHGITGQFDLDQTLTVTGVVNRVRFVNPHAYVYFMVTNDAGEDEQWRCELRSGSLLKRAGWSADMFAPGTQIIVTGSPDRRDPKTCYAQSISFEDGRVVRRRDTLNEAGKVVPGKREPTLEDGTPNIAGNWFEARGGGPPPRGGPGQRGGTGQRGGPSQRVDPGQGGGPGPGGRPSRRGGGRPPRFEMTQIGQDEADDYTEEQNPRFICQPTNIIFDYNFDQMVNKIEQSETKIVITYGFMDVVRTIHLVGVFPDEIEPSVTGYSVGQWKDDTLIVKTKGFASGFLEAPGGHAVRAVRHSDQMEITERFYVNKEGTELTREYTVVDPVYLAQPHSHQNKSQLTSNPFISYDCDEQWDVSK